MPTQPEADIRNYLTVNGWKTDNPYSQHRTQCDPNGVAGVYAVVGIDFEPKLSAFVLYVGKSRNLGRRFDNHPVIPESEKFSQYQEFWFLIPEEAEDIGKLERTLIAVWRPPLNIIGKPPAVRCLYCGRLM